MHAPEVYDYAIVRVVPRVEREEFINAGVILSCQRTGFLQAAIALDEARLLAMDPHADIDTVRRHLAGRRRLWPHRPPAVPPALSLAHRQTQRHHPDLSRAHGPLHRCGRST